MSFTLGQSPGPEVKVLSKILPLAQHSVFDCIHILSWNPVHPVVRGFRGAQLKRHHVVVFMSFNRFTDHIFNGAHGQFLSPLSNTEYLQCWPETGELGMFGSLQESNGDRQVRE